MFESILPFARMTNNLPRGSLFLEQVFSFFFCSFQRHTFYNFTCETPTHFGYFSKCILAGFLAGFGYFELSYSTSVRIIVLGPLICAVSYVVETR